MDTLMNANLGYLLLMVGVLLAVMAVITPGTGFFELGALMILLLTGWFVYNLPVNYWALIFLAGGVVLFIIMLLERHRPMSRRFDYLLAASLVVTFIGTTGLFKKGESWLPGANPLLILTVTVLEGGYLWIATRKTIEAFLAPPVQDLERLVGMLGEAKTEVYTDGSVQVAGELWSAHSQAPIPAGSRVRVTGREGFILEVEALE
jgi:membrane-bound serine protease (ClpP class)